MNPKYSDLYFGKSDSRNEITLNEDYFVRSFVNQAHIIDKITSGEKFLVLGPKGTGKSAVAWYLTATESDGAHLALVKDASQLPLAEVPRVQTGQAAGPERTVSAWKFILLCNYLELLMRDQGCSLQSKREVTRVAKILRDYGFMGDASGKALLKASTTTTAIPLPQLGQIYKRENSQNINIFNLIPYLEKWAATAQSHVRHILLLDGLDSIFLNDNKYDESLASLVQAAYSINQQLALNSASGAIVLLMRNDVFSRIALSLPDSQKMRDDQSAQLDWRIMSGRQGTNAPLMQLVNAKAANALEIPKIDVLKYFDSHVQLGGGRGKSPKWIPTFQYLLNYTRHTPRDLLRLFDSIREIEDAGMYASRGSKISNEVLREGVLRYSTDYFVNAIKNELAGFEDGPNEASAALSALKHIGKQRFNRSDFHNALVGELGQVDQAHINRLLTLLFYAGALGNSVGTNRNSYMQFYHRRDDVEIYLQGDFLLATPLVSAWSVPFS